MIDPRLKNLSQTNWFNTFFAIGLATVTTIGISNILNGYFTLSIQYTTSTTKSEKETNHLFRLYPFQNQKFSESTAQPIQVINTQTQDKLATSSVFHTSQRLRLDPPNGINNIKIKHVYLLTSTSIINPLNKLIKIDLMRGYLETTSDLKHVQENQYAYIGEDPKLIWSIPTHNKVTSLVNVANIAFLAISILLLVIISGKNNTHLTILLTTIILLGWLWGLSRHVNANLSVNSALQLDEFKCFLALMMAFIPLICRAKTISAWLLSTQKSKIFRLGHIGILVAVATSLIPDISYRLGLTLKRAINSQYHWRLNRDNNTYSTNAGLNYYTDIQEIADWIEPNSIFLSDRATNYYLSAQLPVYGANPHPHHTVSKDGWMTSVFEEFLLAICGRKTKFTTLHYSFTGFEDYFLWKKRKHAEQGWQAIKYLILNKDLLNHNVASSCWSKQNDFVIESFKSFTKKIYSGEYLDVYEFIYPDI